MIQRLDIAINDSISRELAAKYARVKEYLEAGDMDGLREFVKKEKSSG